MTQGKYVELSGAQRTDVWRRWKAGESLHTIGRAFDRPHRSERPVWNRTCQPIKLLILLGPSEAQQTTFPLESDINSRKVRYVLSILRIETSGRISCRDNHPFPRLEECGQTWRLGIP
jgi:hypothetical protein